MNTRMKLRNLLISGLLLSTLLVGCNQNQLSKNNQEPVTSPTNVENTKNADCSYNKAFEMYDDNITELGLVLNAPTKETIDSLSNVETYKRIDTEEKMLIIPKYNGSKITVSTVDYTGERLIAKEKLYTKEDTSEGYGLLLYAMRPEGLPELMVTVTYKNKSIDYIVATDGKNGNKEIEYLKLEPENAQTAHEGDVIMPSYDKNYLDGLNLFSKYAVDFDLDGENEEIEVYCQGSIEKDGSYLLDDGQLWTLIVRKGDEIFPLFEKSYIQLGGLGYTVYVDYDRYEELHLLIKYKTGAGLINYDCVFDSESGRFIRETVYEASNINILRDWNFD